MDLVYGTLWYRLIFRVGTLGYAWADDMASGISPPPADGTGRPE